jgi:putative transposase
MTEIAFGQLRFDRGSIPGHLRDLSAWPTVDVSALDEGDRASFTSRRRAIELFVEYPNMSLSSIKSQTGVDPKSLYRMIERCLAKHSDGRIYGFRAAIPYARLKRYERIHSIDREVGSKGSGLAGAFGLLLARYPSLEKFLLAEAKKRHEPITEAREVRKSVKRIHKRFLDECRKLGIKQNEYPLNQALAGLRSLASFLKNHDNRSYEAAARSAGADHIGPPMPEEMDKAPPATRAFEVIEFDGHKIDLRISLKIVDPFGFEDLVELSRIWILVLLDVASRAVIGYKLAISTEYNKDDVAAALQAALIPFRPRSYRIPGLSIRAGGGFPSAVLPATEYACWEWFRFDGAKSHLAADTLSRLNQIVGCWPDNGPPAEPNKRKYIERFFPLLAEHFAHRLPGTTGSDPDSIERALSDPKGNLSLLVELDELEDMVEVLIADYNGTSHPGISNRTPLEAMAQLIARDSGYIRTLPRVMRTNLCLLQEAKIVTIKGSLDRGTRPHINFLEVKYSSDVLSSNPRLIGKKVRIYYDVRDIRFVKAFFEDGSELGVLTAARPWCWTPHSVRVRQDIMRQKRLGKLKYREGDDPVEAWEKLKRSEAKTSKRAATALAKAKKDREALGHEARPSPIHRHSPAGQEAPPVGGPQVEKASSPEEVTRPEPTPGTPPQPRELKLKRTFTF